MDFIANQQSQINEMLKVIGIGRIDDLFDTVPENIKVQAPKEDDGLSEFEGKVRMETVAALNTFSQMDNYMGAGAYEHYIPAITQAICSKSEFLTSYTPYQAEASQGTLQSMFEFQEAICALTGMDIANASVYDGASACAEALLMALRYYPERKKVLVADSLHPHYRATIAQYMASKDVKISPITSLQGKIDIDDDTAAILVQQPNFFGVMEDLTVISDQAKKCGTLLIISANPLSYGIFPSAREYGASIACGDGQPFGVPLNFGGPYVGYIACVKELMRQLPGRIVGVTHDVNGNSGYVLTLQAREQHIRREKATSNICTSQSLCALASLTTLLWYGKEGIRQLALTNYQRTMYLKNKLASLPNLSIEKNLTIFNEFVVHFKTPKRQVLEAFRKEKIMPGVDLETFYPFYKDSFLVAVTETKSKKQLDKYVDVARGL